MRPDGARLSAGARLSTIHVPRIMPQLLRRCIFLLLLGTLLCALLLAADWWISLSPGRTADYVGRQKCAECHETETSQWADSDHDLAMQLATPATVLGNFDNQCLTRFGVTSELFRRGEEFCIRTDGPTGEMETYRIEYTFGVHPLQQYLVRFPNQVDLANGAKLPGGSLQCLPIAWDTQQECWFHLYQDEKIPVTASDELHWTRPSQNWNYMCAECHSTNLEMNYDLKTHTYRTTFSEIDVSCETCHGPGSLHVELAESWGVFWDRRYGYGLPDLKSDDPRVEIETCAPCHSRRRIVYPGFRPGKKLLDHYYPALLDGNLYYADGQILEEDYVYGSFIQSRMYREQVRCTDCHDPHTARVKFADNRLCGQCHLPTTYDTPTHHHHPDGSQPGTLCVECHMPETTYMVVDPRRDHSIRVPRPDLTVSLSIPNACNGCHHDQAKGETPQWAAEKVLSWYGKPKEPEHFAYAIAAGRQTKPEGQQALAAVARRKDTSAMVRASAILLLAGYPDGAQEAAAFAGLEDPEALVRAAAVRSLEHLPLEGLYRRLGPMLHDPVRAVRSEAARLLSGLPLRMFSSEDRQAFDAALAEYMAGQEAVADQAPAHLNMAVVYANLGQIDKAEREYRTAIRLNPEFVPARNNLGQLYVRQGRTAEAEAEYLAAVKIAPRSVPVRDGLARLFYRQGKLAQAEEQFRKVIELEPDWGETHFFLGQLLAEDKDRLAEAAEHLTTASRLMPTNAQFHYNRGLALQHLGRVDQAEAALKRACQLDPGSTRYLYALTILYTQQNQWARAQEYAQRLVMLGGNEPRFVALAKIIERALRESALTDPEEPAEGPGPKR